LQLPRLGGVSATLQLAIVEVLVGGIAAVLVAKTGHLHPEWVVTVFLDNGAILVEGNTGITEMVLQEIVIVVCTVAVCHYAAFAGEYVFQFVVFVHKAAGVIHRFFDGSVRCCFHSQFGAGGGVKVVNIVDGVALVQVKL
nr:hypothetical protein [Bacteroidota bacterium]